MCIWSVVTALGRRDASCTLDVPHVEQRIHLDAQRDQVRLNPLYGSACTDVEGIPHGIRPSSGGL
jgi:hypothetical protein